MEVSATQRQKITFLGTQITVGSYDSFIDRIFYLAQKRLSSYVCVMNVHMLIEAHSEKSFANVVSEADLVTPDGMPLVVGMNTLYGINQERVAGMDLMASLLDEAQRLNVSVYFYGSTDKVLDTVVERSLAQYPDLKIAGTYSPPFRPLSQVEESNIIATINATNAGIVLVALGCPKQEKWMASMKGQINAVMIGLGGAFPVFAGLQPRAPFWMQKYGLEWLYRLIQEPGRLWKRYFVTNTAFIMLFLKNLIKVKVFNKVHNIAEIQQARLLNS